MASSQESSSNTSAPTQTQAEAQIVVVSGTDRPGSRSLDVASYLIDRFREQPDTQATLLDLNRYPLADVAGGPYGSNRPESVDRFNAPFMQADGIVFVVPEYNGSFPGILKLFIDYLPFPQALKDRPVAFIGEASGYFGGLRAVEQLQMVAAYRYAKLYPERVFIPAVHKEFDRRTGLSDAFRQSLLASLIEGFARHVRREAALVTRV